MFKKDDILPLILASVTTVLIVVLGFSWLTKSSIGKSVLLSEIDKEAGDNDNRPADARAATATDVRSNLVPIQTAVNSSQKRFVLPVIVPQGTSVSINGSAKLNEINQILRRSFHQQYPGTVITTEGDGSTAGLDLLYSRDIDLVALDRPLSQAEKEAGLTQISIYNSKPEGNVDDSQMYYVYKEPLSPDTEAFLGYVFSKKGQQAIEEL